MRRSAALVLAALWWTPPLTAEETLPGCRELALAEGPSERAAECFFLLSREGPELAAAARDELDALRGLHPQAPWPHYYRGRVPPWLDHGESHLRTAAELFTDRGELSAAIRARFYLVTWYMLWHLFEGRETDLEAARSELARLEVLLERSDLPQDRALGDMAEAHYLMLSGGDLEGARLLLLNAHLLLEQAPGVHRHEMSECVRSLLDVALRLGLVDEAAYWADESLRLAVADGRLRDQARAAYDVTNHRLLTELPRDDRRWAILEDLYTTLELARSSGATWIEAATGHLIAELEGGGNAARHLERCVELAGGDNELSARCLKALATLHLADEPDTARDLLERANVAEDQGPWSYLAAWDDQMRVLWETASPARALEDSQAILTLIEALRHNQIGSGSDRLLSTSADAYYWLSGKLLDLAHGGGDAGSIARAFSVIERLRAQALREVLESGPEATARTSPEVARALGEIDARYVGIIRRLFDLGLGPEERRGLLTELDRLDQEAAELRRRGDALAAPLPVLEPPGPGLLELVQGALGPDEALLSYQVGLWQGWDRRFLGGSWLLVLTGEDHRTYRLEADRAALEPAVKALRGLPDPEDPQALAAFYERLLEPALSELPPEIRKIILIPDGLLHLLPFSLLRPGENAPPLIERFELQIVPSATVWLHWREGTPLPMTPGAGALVLANPLTPSVATASRGRDASLGSVATLGPLPYAEREGRRVLRHLGGSGRLEVAGEASERLLKTADLAPYRILHFAAHAYLDLKRPALSGVVLAPGSATEDGLLRPSEIARLAGLEGKLVVLAACNTAAGEVLRGEGVLSLARAFFEGGAEAVVASLWRLDDRLATRFFDDFYRRLRDGASVSRALADTQAEWSASGKPASTWAGLVALGNGDFVPLPGGVPPGLDRRWPIAAALVALLALAALVLLSQRSAEHAPGGGVPRPPGGWERERG